MKPQTTCGIPLEPFRSPRGAMPVLEMVFLEVARNLSSCAKLGDSKSATMHRARLPKRRARGAISERELSRQMVNRLSEETE